MSQDACIFCSEKEGQYIIKPCSSRQEASSLSAALPFYCKTENTVLGGFRAPEISHWSVARGAWLTKIYCMQPLYI